MGRRIRIPWLVDIVRLDEPEAIATATRDQSLDRDFARGGGPLVNRMLASRIHRIMQVDGEPLPSLAPRGHPQRAERQDALETRLDALLQAQVPAPEHVDRLAAYVRGDLGGDAIGPLVQEAIGRLFEPDYAATRDTFEAARLMNDAPRNRNPLRALLWALTGSLARARRMLAGPVKGDTQAMHATTIAVHTLVRSFEAMRALRIEPGLPDRLTTEAAVVRSLRAPPSVLRRWSRRSSTPFGDMPEGALAVFELDRARLRDPGCEVVFMTQSWSRCPAYRWCEALLAIVWEKSAGPDPLTGGSAP